MNMSHLFFKKMMSTVLPLYRDARKSGMEQVTKNAETRELIMNCTYYLTVE